MCVFCAMLQLKHLLTFFYIVRWLAKFRLTCFLGWSSPSLFHQIYLFIGNVGVGRQEISGTGMIFDLFGTQHFGLFGMLEIA